MNRSRILLVAVLVLGLSSLVFSQDQDKEPKAPPQSETPHDVAPPRAQEEKSPKPEKQEVQKPEKQKQTKDDKANREQKDMSNGDGARAANARPAGKGAHIPEPKFKTSFGQQHKFAVNQVVTQRTIVAGQTQFVYSGYTFIIDDPWPAEWAFTDDCYIDYINDEYVLVDVLHPGIYVTLLVVG